MADPVALSDAIIDAYNGKAFDRLEALIAKDIDFAHFNRDFVFHERAGLIQVLRGFAANYMPDRRFLEPERVTVSGAAAIREAFYVGTLTADLPGFGVAGGAVRLKFCSIMTFNGDGLLAEWKDYG